MAKHAEQLRYAHEANSQAFHFLFIYSKDKEQLKKKTKKTQQAVHASGGRTGPLFTQLHYLTGSTHFGK